MIQVGCGLSRFPSTWALPGFHRRSWFALLNTAHNHRRGAGPILNEPHRTGAGLTGCRCERRSDWPAACLEHPCRALRQRTSGTNGWAGGLLATGGNLLRAGAPGVSSFRIGGFLLNSQTQMKCARCSEFIGAGCGPSRVSKSTRLTWGVLALALCCSVQAVSIAIWATARAVGSWSSAS
jgi:hypothetical protein